MTKILYIPEGRYLSFALPAEFPVSEYTGVSDDRTAEFESSYIYLKYYDFNIFSIEYADMFKNVLNKTKSPIEDFIDKLIRNESKAFASYNKLIIPMLREEFQIVC